MKKRGTGLRRYGLFMGVTCVFCAVLLAAFLGYNRYQDRQFEALEHQNLIAEARWQSQRVRTERAKLTGQLEAAADLVVSSGLPPEGAWLRDYLERIAAEEDYSIVYTDIGDLRRELSGEAVPPGSRETYRQLLDGAAVTSKIRWSDRLQGYYFAVGEPVRRDGETIGVLRCTIPAETLLREPGDSGERFPFLQCVVDQEGLVLYSGGSEDLAGEDLLSWLDGQGAEEAGRETLRQAREAGRADAVTLRACRWTLTTVPLPGGRQGWSLVQLTEAGSYQEVSDRLLGSTVLVGVLLVVLSLGAAWAVFRLLQGQDRRLALEQQKFYSLASMFGAVFFEYDHHRDTLTLTTSEQSRFALETGTIRHCRRHAFQAVHPEDAESLRQVMVKPRKEPFALELRLLDRDGAWRWCECPVRPLLLDGRQAAMAGRILDVNERKLRELQLLEENATDELTGLLNRTSFRQAVDDLTARAAAGFLFMCDLDNFKSVNDSQGHAAGDRLLCQVAGLLQSCFRAGDPVARHGGDEFVVYMANTADRALAAAKAEQILEKLARFSRENRLPISASVGIACCPEDGGTYEELYRRADDAMYRAKNQGKQSYCFCREE